MAYPRNIKNQVNETAKHEFTPYEGNSSLQTQEESTAEQNTYLAYIKKTIISRFTDPWRVLGWLLVAMVFWWYAGQFGLLPTGNFPTVPHARIQGVFLINGQVYFGMLKNYNARYVRLENIYYLQAAQPLQQLQEAPSAQSFNLTKLGGELHGPEDAMFIDKDKILFWENLKPDSQVVKAIESTKK